MTAPFVLLAYCGRCGMDRYQWERFAAGDPDADGWVCSVSGEYAGVVEWPEHSWTWDGNPATFRAAFVAAIAHEHATAGSKETQ